MRSKIVDFEQLPFWQGVQNKPGVYGTLPFALEWDNQGFVSQISDAMQRSLIIGQYSSDGYNFITSPPGLSTWANRLGDTEVQFILRSCGSFIGKTVLEIGAGSLYLGEKIIEYGASKYVIMDPAIKEKSFDMRIEVVKEYFCQDRCEDQLFDVIICLNCLEHLDEPVKFLQELRLILKKTKGCAILSFPDIGTQFANGDLNALLHEHMNYFTFASAERLIKNCGFSIDVSEKKSDCVRFKIGLQDSYSAEYPTQMDEEYSNSSQVFQHNVSRVQKCLHEAMKSGDRVAIHGATNGTNNAIYFAGAGQYEHLWVFDGDETKAGKYLPLCINPIQHSSVPYYKEIPLIYVAALTYFDEIKKELIQKHHFSDEQIIPLFSGLDKDAQ